MRAFFSTIITLVIFLGLCASTAHADSLFTAIRSSDISVNLTPENPGPFQDVTISLQSYVVDLNKTPINWFIDGKASPSGTGNKSLRITTGATGSTTSVVVEIVVNGTDTIKKNIVIQPAEIDLLWQAIDSYVPPFYKGKALPSSESRIRIVALPQVKIGGKNYKTNDFTYSWSRNYAVSLPDSGFAKNTFVYKNSYLNDSDTVSVVAEAVGSSASARSEITLKPGSPKILFYENNPLYGTRYQASLGNIFNMGTSETAIDAEPYFFSVKNPNDKDLELKWVVNNQGIGDRTPKNILPVRKNGTGGSSKIDISIQSYSKLFQTAKNALFINL